MNFNYLNELINLINCLETDFLIINFWDATWFHLEIEARDREGVREWCFYF